MYLINDPWAVKVSVLGGLPPADASRCRAGPEWDLQGHESGLIAAVAEKKFLEEAPAETPVHWELQQDRLGARVRSRLTTAKTEEELNKPAEYSYMRPSLKTQIFWTFTDEVNECLFFFKFLWFTWHLTDPSPWWPTSLGHPRWRTDDSHSSWCHIFGMVSHHLTIWKGLRLQLPLQTWIYIQIHAKKNNNFDINKSSTFTGWTISAPAKGLFWEC